MYTLSECKYKLERQNPSFASAILDEIYNSIIIEDAKDGSRNIHEQHSKFYPEWMGRKQITENAIKQERRNVLKGLHHEQDALSFTLAPSCSDTISGGLSSANLEHFHGLKPRTVTKERTMFRDQKDEHNKDSASEQKPGSEQNPKLEDTKIKTKSRGYKICSSLKKIKQVISPKGRLKSFLNNLFTAGHTEKAKHPSPNESCDDVKAERL